MGNNADAALARVDAGESAEEERAVRVDSGAVEVASCWWHRWTRWAVVGDKQERRCVKCNLRERINVEVCGYGGL